MSLSERDLIYMNIQSQIKAKHNMLLKKQTFLKKQEKDNEFLKSVRNDYINYFQIIVKQKQQQLDSMNLLTQYLKDLIISEKLTETDLLKAKIEQKNIVVMMIIHM